MHRQYTPKRLNTSSLSYDKWYSNGYEKYLQHCYIYYSIYTLINQVQVQWVSYYQHFQWYYNLLLRKWSIEAEKQNLLNFPQYTDKYNN